MNVLHINSYCSDSKFYKNLFVEEAKCGIELKAYIPVSNSTDTSAMDFGKDAVISKSYDKIDRFSFVAKHKKILDDVQQKINVSDFDLIHAHSLFSNGYIAYKLSEKYNIPYIVAVRDTDVNFFFKYMPFMRRLGLEILNHAKKVIFISPIYRENALKPYVKDYLNSDVYNKSIVVTNGADDFWLSNTYSEKQVEEKDEINVLCVARISARKNLITLSDACKQLYDAGHNVKLTVVGKVEDKKIYDKISSYPCVNVCAPCNKEKLIEYYRSSDLFALASRTETFGLVYLEAMSQGLPVVYTRGQGFDNQFPEGEIGYSVDADNVKEISEKIMLAYNNRSKLVARCIEGVKKYNWQDIAKKYDEIYNEAIK